MYWHNLIKNPLKALFVTTFPNRLSNKSNYSICRRTSTPEIVRIRTTAKSAASAAHAATSGGSAALEDSESARGEKTRAGINGQEPDIVRHGLRTVSEVAKGKGCEDNSNKNDPNKNNNADNASKNASKPEVVRYKVQQQPSLERPLSTTSSNNNKNSASEKHPMPQRQVGQFFC